MSHAPLRAWSSVGSLSGCIGRVWGEDLAAGMSLRHGLTRPIVSTRNVAPARIEWEEDKTALADLSLQLSISSLRRRPCFIPFHSGRKAGRESHEASHVSTIMIGTCLMTNGRAL